MKFTIQSKDKNSLARTGTLQTDHSTIDTPVFMPVGTHGVVKSLSPDELYDLDTNIMLSNTYHLYLRPGTDIIQENGGLHQFLNWSNSILTDSGGYQVFSLNKMNKITDDGVHFKSHLDGSMHFFTPEVSMEVQQKLGSDIIMAFDYCPPGDCSKKELERASDLTHQWTKRAYDYLKTHENLYNHQQTLFPIIQGGIDKNERLKCVDQMLSFVDCGIAIGGLSVGEKKEPMFNTVQLLGESIPEEYARYLMGVGKPTDIVKSPDKIKKYLEDAEYKLYNLIWKRTVASQMIDATYQQVGINFLLADKYQFKYSGSFLKHNGFKEIYDLSENDEKEKLNKRILQDLK